jgi:hypothetical protein
MMKISEGTIHPINMNKGTSSNELHPDVTLKVGSYKFTAHQKILCSRCPYFYTLLQKELQQYANSMEVEIEIRDSSPEIFCNILRYIYLQQVEINQENAVPMLQAAQLYNLQDLQERIEDYLGKQLTIQNMWYYWKLSHELGANILKAQCAAFFADNIGEVVKTEGFTQHSQDILLGELAIEKSNNNLNLTSLLKDTSLLRLDSHTPPPLPLSQQHLNSLPSSPSPSAQSSNTITASTSLTTQHQLTSIINNNNSGLNSTINPQTTSQIINNNTNGNSNGNSSNSHSNNIVTPPSVTHINTNIPTSILDSRTALFPLTGFIGPVTDPLLENIDTNDLELPGFKKAEPPKLNTTRYDYGLVDANSFECEQINSLMALVAYLVSATRITCFLHAPDSNELYSVAKTPVEAEFEIRIPANMGIAGWVFTRNEIVNTPNAYSDERFLRAIDQQTGFQTQSVLCVPIVNQNSKLSARKVEGVIQVLNKNDSQQFTVQDEATLKNVAQLIADLLDKLRENESVNSPSLTPPASSGSILLPFGSGRHDVKRASPRVGSAGQPFPSSSNFMSNGQTNNNDTTFKMKGMQNDVNSKIVLPPSPSSGSSHGVKPREHYRFSPSQEKATTTPTPKRRKKSKFPIFHFRLPKQGTTNKN